MMGKRYISALVFVVTAILAVAVLFRLGRRYYALNRLAHLPLANQRMASQRMAIQPSKKLLLESGELEDYVDLGYCRFALPSMPPPRMSKLGVSQTCVSLTNEIMSLVWLPPFAANPEIGVQVEIDVEESVYPDFWQVLFMGRRQFIPLITALSLKAGTTRGWNEIYSYISSNTVGLVRIGDSVDDRLHASASISSISGNRHVGFHLEIRPESSVNIGSLLDVLLSTFEFTTESIPDEQVLAKLIREANRE